MRSSAMTERWFLVYSSISCVAIAVGAVGPWASGYLGFAGADGYGIVTLAGAALAALALWRWSIDKSPTTLIVPQVAGSLCLAIAVYATYYEIYDPYSDAGDTWLNFVDWGLILTFIGAGALVTLCLRRYWSYRSPERRSRGWSDIGFLVSVVPVLVMSLWVLFAVGSDKPTPESRLLPEKTERPIPDYALKIAEGRAGGATWGVWLFGNGEGENCLGSRTVKDKFPSAEGAIGDREEAYCGLGVPPRYWQQVIEGPVGDRGDRRSALIFLTRRAVDDLEVLTGRTPDRGGELTWTRVQAQAITKQQARTARLRPNLGYAVAVVTNPACVRRVQVFDRRGERIERSPFFPCAFGEGAAASR